MNIARTEQRWLVIVKLLKKTFVKLSELVVTRGCPVSLRHLVNDAGHDIFSEFGFAMLALTLIKEFEGLAVDISAVIIYLVFNRVSS
jgi:hypothetical protein